MDKNDYGLFKNYTKAFDDYFKNNEILIKSIPNLFESIREKTLHDKKIKNVRELHKHILIQKEFWITEVTGNNYIVSEYPDYIKAAETHVNNAINKDSLYDLGLAIKYIEKVQIYSKSNLTNFFLKYKNEESHFFYGFESVFEENNSSNYKYTSWHKGIYLGLEYIKAITGLNEIILNQKDNIANIIEESVESISYITSKLEDDYLGKLNDYRSLLSGYESFVKEKEERIEQLEGRYKLKTALEDPANDWLDLGKKYFKSGIIWLVLGFLLGFFIVCALIYIIINLPNLFEDEDWINLARQTALLSVITGVSIFGIRIIIKLAISSLHLSRDATERNRLTKFFLHMNDSKLIRDEERHLIIQSLFSRSDTGLLKDSSPELPSPIEQLKP